MAAPKSPSNLLSSTMSQLVHRQLQQHRFAHTVRIICCQDLPNGAASRHQVTQVKAGYARNYLLPQKLAVYATRANFDKFNLVDPELETLEQRRARQAAAAAKDDDVEAHAADILRRYLAHKTVRLVAIVDILCDYHSHTLSLETAQDLAQRRGGNVHLTARHGRCQGGPTEAGQAIAH